MPLRGLRSSSRSGAAFSGRLAHSWLHLIHSPPACCSLAGQDRAVAPRLGLHGHLRGMAQHSQRLPPERGGVTGSPGRYARISTPSSPAFTTTYSCPAPSAGSLGGSAIATIGQQLGRRVSPPPRFCHCYASARPSPCVRKQKLQKIAL